MRSQSLWFSVILGLCGDLCGDRGCAQGLDFFLQTFDICSIYVHFYSSFGKFFFSFKTVGLPFRVFLLLEIITSWWGRWVGLLRGERCT